MTKFKLFIAFMLVAVMAIPSAAGKVKTAKFKDNVLTEQRYNYTMNVLDNWKVKTFKEKDEKRKLLRALILQKTYRIHQAAKDLDADFTIPEIQIYARPDTTSPMTYLEQLRNDVKGHRSEDEITNQLNLILSGEFVGMQETILDNISTIQAVFKRQWRRELQADEDDNRYRQYGGLVVRDVHDVHEVYILNYNGCLYVIQAFAENEFYPMVKEEFREIIASIKFGDAVSSQTEGKSSK